jgi:hypothetical protein
MKKPLQPPRIVNVHCEPGLPNCSKTGVYEELQAIPGTVG